MPENFAGMLELVKQDCHVTDHEKEICLDISVTSIYKILHEHLAVKKNNSRWILLNLISAKKNALVNWC